MAIFISGLLPILTTDKADCHFPKVSEYKQT